VGGMQQVVNVVAVLSMLKSISCLARHWYVGSLRPVSLSSGSSRCATGKRTMSLLSTLRRVPSLYCEAASASLHLLLHICKWRRLPLAVPEPADQCAVHDLKGVYLRYLAGT
jgi:hypothetical protein